MFYHADAWHRRGRLKHFSGLLLTGILIGCGIDPTLGPFDTQTQASALQTPETQVSGSVAEQSATAPDATATIPAKPAEPRPSTPTEIVSLPPLQLLGMSRADVFQHLGKPSFQRRDRTALLLRYRERGCILDLFLYPHDQSGLGKAVDYIEARTPDGQRIKTEPCVDAIRKAHSAG